MKFLVAWTEQHEAVVRVNDSVPEEEASDRAMALVFDGEEQKPGEAVRQFEGEIVHRLVAPLAPNLNRWFRDLGYD